MHSIFGQLLFTSTPNICALNQKILSQVRCHERLLVPIRTLTLYLYINRSQLFAFLRGQSLSLDPHSIRILSRW